MLVLGIYSEDIHMDSSFSYASDAAVSTTSLQAGGHIADLSVYLEKNSLDLLGQFLLVRQSARTSIALRISQCMLALLLVIGAYLLFLSFRNPYLCTGAYDNQYNRRTLEYIHHNDGKKD